MKKFYFLSPSKSFHAFFFTLFLILSTQSSFAQFSAPTIVTPSLGINDLDVADFDMDGDLDVVMVKGAGIGSYRMLVIYVNEDGMGTNWVAHEFDTQLDFTTMRNIEVQDFNNDGWMDFIVTGSDIMGSYYYQNSAIPGVIHFDKNSIPLDNYFTNLEAGDLNGDGLMDFVSTINGVLQKSFQEPNVMFGPTDYMIGFVQGGPQFQDLRLADIDNDNDLDIVGARSKGIPNYYTGDLIWFENEDGLGNFAPLDTIAFLDSFTNVVTGYRYLNTGDFDGDGWLDLLVFQDSLKIIYRNATGGFLESQLISDAFFVDELDEFIIHDLDEDGDLDIINPGNVDNALRWYRNTDGAGNFEEVVVGSTKLSDDQSAGAIGDVEGDGDLDFFFHNDQHGLHGLHLFFNDGTNENFTDETKISDNIVGPFHIIPTDVDLDGDEDLMYVASTSGNLYWTENLDGNGALSNPILLFEDDQMRTFDLSDLDGDGDDDIIVSFKANGGALAQVYIHERISDVPEYAPKTVLLESSISYPKLIASDFDNDGDNDIIVEQNTNIIWLENMGNLVFEERPELVYGDLVAVCNFDNNDFPDLLYYGFGGDPKMYLRATADGGEEVLIGDQTYYKEVFVADMENDGDDDIVISGRGQGFQNQIRVMYNENGNFTEHLVADELWFLNNSPDITIVDLDADGRKDICVRSYWYRQTENPLDYTPINIVFEQGGGDFPPLATADLTGNGLPDPIFDQIDDYLFWRKNEITDGFFIGGSVFFDEDEDCLYTANPDTVLYGWVVKIENAEEEKFYINTSPLGTYAGFLPDSGSYLFNVLRPSAYWGRCVEDTLVEVNSTSMYGPVDFPVQAEVDCPLLRVNILSGNLRPCIAGGVTVQYCNHGTVAAENVQVTAQIEEWLLVDSISIPWSTSTDSTYTFDVPDVGVGECAGFTFHVTPDCNVVGVGDKVCVTATITPDDICLPIDSLWDGSNIVASGNCVGDTTYFQLQNTGTGDMETPQQYRVEFIVNDDIVMLMQADTFLLDVDEIKEIAVPSNVQAVRIEADQNMFNPLVDIASALVVNCTNPPSNMQAATLMNIFPDEDGNPFSEMACIILTGSYDPNEKTCFPSGIDGRYIENDWELEYNIHFQNTGNDTAFVVRLTDKISENLDLSTLRVGASSHPYIWDLGIDRTLEFTFNDILLPDSLTNELKSQGYVQFFIKPLPDLPVLTDIDNRAFIYFDFNLPIETNTVRRTIRKPVTADSETFELCAGEFFEDYLILADTTVIDTLVDTQAGCFLFFNNITAFPTTFYIDTLVAVGDVFDGQIITQDTVFVYEDVDVNDCLTTTYVNVFLINSNTEVENAHAVKLFPNPVSETVFIYHNNRPLTETTVEIMDLNGKIIQKRNLTNHSLWVGDIPQGVYLLKISIGGEWVIERMVKL